MKKIVVNICIKIFLSKLVDISFKSINITIIDLKNEISLFSKKLKLTILDFFFTTFKITYKDILLNDNVLSFLSNRDFILRHENKKKPIYSSHSAHILKRSHYFFYSRNKMMQLPFFSYASL